MLKYMQGQQVLNFGATSCPVFKHRRATEVVRLTYLEAN